MYVEKLENKSIFGTLCYSMSSSQKYKHIDLFFFWWLSNFSLNRFLINKYLILPRSLEISLKK